MGFGLPILLAVFAFGAGWLLGYERPRPVKVVISSGVFGATVEELGEWLSEVVARKR